MVAIALKSSELSRNSEQCSRACARRAAGKAGSLSSDELEELRQERDDYRDTVDALLSDCDRYLKRIKELEAKFSPETRDSEALQAGHQSAVYRRVKAVLDRFINEVKGDG